MDYTWGQKYHEATDLKETEFQKMKKDLSGLIDKERRENGEKVKTLITDFKLDM